MDNKIICSTLERIDKIDYILIRANSTNPNQGSV